jgi:germination protein M
MVFRLWRNLKAKNTAGRSDLLALALLLAVLAPLALAGCWGGKSTTQQPPANSTGQTNKPATNKPAAPAVPQTQTVRLTLYFGDRQALHLIPEERDVQVKGQATAAAVVGELIKGPAGSNLVRTVPPEAALRSIRINQGVCYADFSREFQSKHEGGSTGEIFTLMSITDSLATLPGIDKVQFLLEGQVKDSILGNTDTSQPLAPDWNLVQK